MSKSHVNHSVNLAGLILNPDFLYLGASPDGIVNCSCCGVGCLEIKCSSKYRDNLKKLSWPCFFLGAAFSIRIKPDKNYFRKSQENANFSLRKPYYQNFWQIFLASQPSLMQEVLEKCVIVTWAKRMMIWLAVITKTAK